MLLLPRVLKGSGCILNPREPTHPTKDLHKETNMGGSPKRVGDAVDDINPALPIIRNIPQFA